VRHHYGVVDRELKLLARHLAILGYVALVPDSFGPCGAGTICANGAVWPEERVPDAYAAAAQLRDVRPDRIGLIGFPHGSGAIVSLVLYQPPP
jgi:dienelactone hydrolase